MALRWLLLRFLYSLCMAPSWSQVFLGAVILHACNARDKVAPVLYAQPGTPVLYGQPRTLAVYAQPGTPVVCPARRNSLRKSRSRNSRLAGGGGGGQPFAPRCFESEKEGARGEGGGGVISHHPITREPLFIHCIFLTCDTSDFRVWGIFCVVCGLESRVDWFGALGNDKKELFFFSSVEELLEADASISKGSQPLVSLSRLSQGS